MNFKFPALLLLPEACATFTFTFTAGSQELGRPWQRIFVKTPDLAVWQLPLRQHFSEMRRAVPNLTRFCGGSGFITLGRTSRTATAVMSVSRLSSTSSGRLDVSGVYPPIATPFNKDESIAFDKLTENMLKWNKIPFGGKIKTRQCVMKYWRAYIWVRQGITHYLLAGTVALEKTSPTNMTIRWHSTI